MNVIARKICLLGDFAVGKTSLVARYVHSTFNERYLTTVGVKVDTRSVQRTDGAPVKVVLWDLAGVTQLNAAGRAYIGGAHGLLYVCDSTRAETLDSALQLKRQVDTLLGTRPALLLVNKSDLLERQEIDATLLAANAAAFLAVFRTSALSGAWVEEAFTTLIDACG
jgi:small GTP-binding protein